MITSNFMKWLECIDFDSFEELHALVLTIEEECSHGEFTLHRGTSREGMKFILANDRTCDFLIYSQSDKELFISVIESKLEEESEEKEYYK